MTVVRVTAVPGGAEGAFAARVAVGEGTEYEVAVTAPGDAASERLLTWYFEEHLRYPFLDRDLERQAVTVLQQYGQALFGQVFGGDAWRITTGGSGSCRLTGSGSR